MDTNSSVGNGSYLLKSPGEIKNDSYGRPVLAIFLLALSMVFFIYLPGAVANTVWFDFLMAFIVVSILYALATIGILIFNYHLLNYGLPADKVATWSIILSNMTFVGSNMNSTKAFFTWVTWFLLYVFLLNTPAYFKLFLHQEDISFYLPSETVNVALNGVGGCNPLYCSITSQAIMYNQTADPSTLRYQACEPGFESCITPFLPSFAGFAEPQSANSNPGYGTFSMSQIPGVYSSVSCSVSPVDKSAFPVRSDSWQGQTGQIMVNVGINNSSTTTANHQLQVYVGRAGLVWYINCSINFSLAQANLTWKLGNQGTTVDSFSIVKMGPNPLISSLPPTFANFDNNLMVPLQNTIGIQYSARIQYLAPDVVLNDIRAYAQSYAAMTSLRSAYLDSNGTASSTFSQGIQQPLIFNRLFTITEFFLGSSMVIFIIALIAVLIVSVIVAYCTVGKPVFTGSAVQIMSLASGMHIEFGGGSSPCWMESKKPDTPIVKIRVCKTQVDLASGGEVWHLEYAAKTSRDHVDLTPEEIEHLYRYKIE